MKIIFFDTGPVNSSLQDQLIKIEGFISQSSLHTYRSHVDLSQDLKSIKNSFSIAILKVHNDNELIELIGLKELLRNMLLIIILPNQQRSTMLLAAHLNPRYISNAEENIEEVGDVLKKLIEIVNSREVNNIGNS